MRSGPASDVSERCPDDETIAALVDGRLRTEERRQILAHVARCAACYLVFTETTELVRGTGDSRRRYVSPWLGAALAAGLAAVALGVGLRRASPPAEVPPASPQAEVRRPPEGPDPVARLAQWAQGRDLERPWRSRSASRGLAPSANTSGQAVRVGIADADLELAIRRGDPASIQAAITSATDGQRSHARGSLHTGLMASLAAGGNVQAFLADLRRPPAGIDEVGWRRGRLLEAARLAAWARSRSFFLDPGTRGALAELVQGLPEQPSTGRLTAALAEVGKGEEPPLQVWSQLAHAVEDVILTLT